MVKKPRPHDYCYECGHDFGEIPPTPPRCRHCRRTVKGHEGPWGVGRCQNEPPSREVLAVDKFLAATLDAWSKELDRMFMEDRPGVIATLGGERR